MPYDPARASDHDSIINELLYIFREEGIEMVNTTVGASGVSAFTDLKKGDILLKKNGKIITIEVISTSFNKRTNKFYGAISKNKWLHSTADYILFGRYDRGSKTIATMVFWPYAALKSCGSVVNKKNAWIHLSSGDLGFKQQVFSRDLRECLLKVRVKFEEFLKLF